MTQTFLVENIKCGGCMSSIRQGLEQLPGVAAARTDQPTGTVTVDFDENLVSADSIVRQLAALGYPLEGHNSLGRQARSYVSCMLGRIAKD